MSAPIQTHRTCQHGKWNGGWVPTGYLYDKKAQKLAPNPDEQKLVEELQSGDYLKNPTAVAKHLNRLGCRTRQRTLIRKDGATRSRRQALHRISGARDDHESTLQGND